MRCEKCGKSCNENSKYCTKCDDSQEKLYLDTESNRAFEIDAMVNGDKK